ncbi:hypothetical protein pipiens_012094 [Culex pipiens pipiens]|uniref:Uncharacterized protein n=1 Tax=Culex pipiens pipiens TaxID=38569 RepID=A0ABD1D3T8_CULPP
MYCLYQINIQLDCVILKMKFVLIFAAVLAVAYASAIPAQSVEEEMHKALVEAGVDPDVASGWLSNFASKIGGFVKKAVPYVQTGLKIYGALGG